MLILKSAECPGCFSYLPLSSRWKEVRLAPYFINCAQCKMRIQTTFSYRTTWMYHLMMRAVMLISLILFLALSVFYILMGKNPVFSIIGSLFFTGIMVFGGGLILSLLGSMPIQAMVDGVRAVKLAKEGSV